MGTQTQFTAGLENSGHSAILASRAIREGASVARKVDTKWFLDAIADRGLSQRGVAGIIGMDRGSFNRLLKGQRNLRLEEADIISRTLGAPVDVVLRKFGLQAEKPARALLAVTGSVSARTGRIAEKLPAGTPRKAERPTDATDSTLAFFMAAEDTPFHGWTFYADRARGVTPAAVSRLAIVKEAGSDRQWLCIPRAAVGERGKWTLGHWDGRNLGDQPEAVALEWATPVSWIRT